MLKIHWQMESGNVAGNTIFTGKYCGLDCDMLDAVENFCRAGFALEDEDLFYLLIPGPECPGPGSYKLVRIEGDERDGILGQE